MEQSIQRANRDVRLSKFLSLVLRHKPETIGLALDTNGWVGVNGLLEKCRRAGRCINPAELLRVVETNDKRRFSLSADGKRIRAAQGHSVHVDLDLAPQTPPELLYHGTAARFLESILTAGLTPQARHHVHLSADFDTALRVGRRHGAPVVLRVACDQMHAAGQQFWVSDNGVWLTEHVAPRYLSLLPS